MSAQPKDILKAYFETGDKPTQVQFANLIDSFRSVLDAITSGDLHPDLLELITNGSNANIYTVDGTVPENRAVTGSETDLTFYNFLNLYFQVIEKFGLVNLDGNKYFVFDAAAQRVAVGDVDNAINGTLLDVNLATRKVIVKAQQGFGLKNPDNFIAYFSANNLGAHRYFMLPNASGTFALVSDIPDISTKADLVGGVVPSSQLPSYVDDVLEFNDYGSFPTTGEAGKIYLAKDANKSYRWSGSTYARLDDSIALGETASTAYRGDRGKTAYDHSQINNANPHGTTTSHISEGTNKYFTDARSIASLLAGFASATGAITSADSIIGAIQKLNGNLAAKVINDYAEAVYSVALGWTVSGTAPTGTTNHTYRWTRIGNCIQFRINLSFGTAGSGVTKLIVPFPTAMPTPEIITDFNNGSTKMTPINATGGNTKTVYNTGLDASIFYNSGTPAINIDCTSQNLQYVMIQGMYFTNS